MSIALRKFILCLIGLLAGLAAWPLIEGILFIQTVFPSFLIFSAFLGMSIGLIVGGFFGSSEGILQSISTRIPQSCALGAFLGAIGGMLGVLTAQALLLGAGEYFIHSQEKLHSIGLPFSRALGWSVLGIGVGIVEGLRTKSLKKIKVGLLGGFLGGLLGGLAMEYSSMLLPQKMYPRLIGLLIFGGFLGFCFSLVEHQFAAGILMLLNGAKKGKEFLLVQQRTWIGKGDTSDIQLNYAQIADRHAEFQIKKGEVIVYALEAKFPVFVNDQQVVEHILKLNDVIKIGNAKFLFLYR